LSVRSREEFLDHVRAAIVVSILGVEDIRCGADQRAFAPAHHTGGKWQAVEKQGGFVEATIAVGV
jgi:hypothetical protein